MSASGGSQERQPHWIGGSGRADPDGDSGLDSATNGEPVNVARGKLADQLRAARMLPSRLPSARFHGTHSCLRWSLCRPIRTALS